MTSVHDLTDEELVDSIESLRDELKASGVEGFDPVRSASIQRVQTEIIYRLARRYLVD